MPTRTSRRRGSNWRTTSRSTTSAARIRHWVEQRRIRHTSARRILNALHEVESASNEDLQPQELHLENRKTCPNKRGHLYPRLVIWSRRRSRQRIGPQWS